ncbi:(2Fe-2S)-binding protein [Shewanella donghaensis]|uniref:(2Fe-2S)-binding protein n=1 Tax=Shewanella donghaensis TaxID=238836 RepID=UPI001183EF2F|nr:2Fe-2S iron-sulfur cluster-binding protein [Shewanella donghaensis]
MDNKQITFVVNGLINHAPATDGDMSLIDYLHERVNLTGTKLCCGIGECRACTVATRNNPKAPMEATLACSTPVSSLMGLEIVTVEGLKQGDNILPLQQAFLQHFSFQCGYCTPGFLMATWILLQKLQMSPIPEQDLDAAIEKGVGRNICRCSGYVRYYEAIRELALPLTMEHLS